MTNQILEQLVGTSLQDISQRDQSWLFRFTNDATISTEMPWRLVGPTGLRVCSEDDGHLFGLQAPVNASELAQKKLTSSNIVRASASKAGDLILEFSGAWRIELLQLSSGYESWHLVIGGRELVCMGGGELHAI